MATATNQDVRGMIGKNSFAQPMRSASPGLVRFTAWLAILALSLGAPLLAHATTVTGRVTSHLTGQALGGIRLSVWYQVTPFSTQEIGAPVTAADGSYAWSGLCGSPVMCHVSVDDERFIYAHTTFSTNIDAVTADFALITPATISGDIRVDGSVPDGPAGLSILRAEGGEWAPVLRTSIDEAGGHFQIHRVPPGSDYRVCAGGTPFGTVEQCFDHHDRSSLAVEPLSDLISPNEAQDQAGVDFDLTSGGRIGGTLRDGYTGTPLAAMRLDISFHDAEGTFLHLAETTADADGAYEVAGIPAGTYYVILRIIDAAFFDQMQVYPAINCDPDCPPATSGQLLTISAGSPAKGIDATFHPSVVFKGRVTDAATGLGLGDIGIWMTNGWYPSATSSPDNGDYMFYASEAGLAFHVFTRGSQPYIDQVFPGVACIQRPCTSGQTFAPVRGSVFDHVDFSLQAGAAVSGTVVDAISGEPRYGTVSMYDSALNLVWSADLDGTGSYASGAWYPGTYYVKAEGYPGYPGYDGCAFYDGRPCPVDGQDPSIVAPTPITIGAGEIRSGIDFQLRGDLLFGDGFDA